MLSAAVLEDVSEIAGALVDVSLSFFVSPEQLIRETTRIEASKNEKNFFMIVSPFF